MADLERKRFSAQHKLANDLSVVAGFLDVHAKADAKTHTGPKPADTVALWPWRKTIGLVLAAGLSGWGVILGAIYLLSRL